MGAGDNFEIGQRVRHYGQQWPCVYRVGTANVVAVGERVFSDGSREIHVQTDDGELTWWNSLSVFGASGTPGEVPS